MTKLTGAAFDRAVANALGVKNVHNCERWGEHMTEEDEEFQRLEREVALGESEHCERPLEQDAEVRGHADGHEEQAQQQALERLDVGLELVPVLAVGEQHAAEEGAEGGGEVEALGHQGSADHQRKREGGEGFRHLGSDCGWNIGRYSLLC